VTDTEKRDLMLAAVFNTAAIFMAAYVLLFA
jgi:hypothetical protein